MIAAVAWLVHAVAEVVCHSREVPCTCGDCLFMPVIQAPLLRTRS